jgi:hypothetical protein
LGTSARALGAGVLGGLVFVTLLGYRTDYAGHFVAGFGGTLGLLALLLAVPRPVGRFEPLGVALFAILLGAGVEATLFRIAIFDPVDFCNQSLGAVLAAAAVQDRRASLATALGLGGLAGVFLVVGALLAFA